MKERYKLLIILAVFAAAYYTPFQDPLVRRSALEAALMLREYARLHVLTCLVPAFFIAGAIALFVSGAAVLKYFGPQANKFLSYAVASVSGTILAVCSCTVLPLFASIYKRGAGIGPATAFLYSGPAINVLAIVLTWRILGFELGLARAVGAVVFAVATGLLMAALFREDDAARLEGQVFLPDEEDTGRNLFQNGVYFLTLVLILVFAAFARPGENAGVLWQALFTAKWYLAGGLLAALALMLAAWFTRGELRDWLDQTWWFMKQILPLLFAGVLVAGFLLGRPGHPALIPEEWVARLVGGNSLAANAVAALSGALMYFATLTEVPILQGLLGAGMGRGPALALLLAGPALSLPNLLVIGSVMGWKKTGAFAGIIVVLSTLAGYGYGFIAA